MWLNSAVRSSQISSEETLSILIAIESFVNVESALLC